MTQDIEKTWEQKAPEATGNPGTPWHVQNPDGSVHGGNGIQPGSPDSTPGDCQDEPLTE